MVLLCTFGFLGLSLIRTRTCTRVPVGTDEYIITTVADRVDDLLNDLHTLKHFTTHGQWALPRMCINQRPVYLQRLLGLQHAGEAFERFDAAVTEKVLDILAMVRQHDRDEMRQRVSALRCPCSCLEAP